MSRYFRRRMHPRPALQIFVCKLLGKEVVPEMVRADAHRRCFILKKTGHLVKIDPHWVTESA